MERISEHLQDSLVLLSITDSDFLKAIGDQVPAEFFESDVTNTTYRICLSYLKKFSKAPGDDFQNALLNFTKDMEESEREILVRYLKHLSEMRKPNKEYVLSKLNLFIRSKILTNALYESAELIEQGEIDIAVEKMTLAIKSGIKQGETAYDMLNDPDLRYNEDKPERLFKLGIPELDKSMRIIRTDFITVAGPYKGGKSWFGHYLGKRALMHGLNVLHVSHENSMKETINRYNMCFGALINEKEPTEILIKEYNVETGKTRKRWELRDTIYNEKLVLANHKKMRKFGGGLRILKFPPRTCTPQLLNACISRLENFEDFVPDLVINDYADIMGTIDNMKQTRDAINEVYIYLKRIADDHNLCMVTFTQINDEGIKTLVHKGRVEGRHLAEDKRKWGNIDKGFYVGATEELEELNESVVGVFANRTGLQGQRCIVGWNCEIGQFACYTYPFRRGE